MGWLEQSKSSGRGFYQITESGKTAVKNWLEQQPEGQLNKELWIVVAKNPKKAAEKLIKSFKTEDLREVYKLIGESFSKKSTVFRGDMK